jgi:hypothetical protein
MIKSSFPFCDSDQIAMLTCWRYANDNDINKKCDVFAILDILARHGQVGQKN